MRFLVDQNLPVDICMWLESGGHAAEHVRLLGMRDASDADIAHRARQTGAILMMRDKDFASHAGGDGPDVWFQVVWVRLGNTANADLIEVLGETWPDIMEAISRGDPVVEVG